MERLFCYVLAVFAVSCGSIAGAVDGAGRFLERDFDGKTVEKYAAADKSLSFKVFSAKDGERQSVFTLKALPGIRFYGTAPDGTGKFRITRLRFLFSGSGGWQEGGAEAYGTGRITKDMAGGAEISIQDSVRPGEITDGQVKLRDGRLYGDRAVEELRNRRERVTAVAEWMAEQGGRRRFDSQDAFIKYWQPVILPETVRKKRRPASYNGTAGKNGDGETVYNEGFEWNAAYTKALFPEHLRPLRDGGVLLRDWEEAPAWFYAEYCLRTEAIRLTGIHIVAKIKLGF
jgi:hypothetical protein